MEGDLKHRLLCQPANSITILSHVSALYPIENVIPIKVIARSLRLESEMLKNFVALLFEPPRAGVPRRCRLSWLTNSALVYEPKCGWGGGGEGLRGHSSANEYSCTQEPKLTLEI